MENRDVRAAGATPAINSVTLALPAAKFAAGGPQHQRGDADGGRFPERQAGNRVQQCGVQRSPVTIRPIPVPLPLLGTTTQTLPRAAQQQITVVWQADDPDGDRLVYSVYFRGGGRNQWKLLKADLHDIPSPSMPMCWRTASITFRVIAFRPRGQPARQRTRGATGQRAGDDR